MMIRILIENLPKRKLKLLPSTVGPEKTTSTLLIPAGEKYCTGLLILNRSSQKRSLASTWPIMTEAKSAATKNSCAPSAQ